MPAYFINPNTDPYHNMAVEEFLFQHFNQPVFHIWQNKSSVIIGRNQLPEAEIDLEFIKNNDIQLVRRFSGGGAVYQDLGNINLSFINSDRNLDFNIYNQQIINFLTSLGLVPTTNNRRAIFIDQKKISGSSQFIRGPKAIYHVTLLFSANLLLLEESLRGNEHVSLQSKHVKSVRSQVTNLSTYFPKDFNILNFRDKIIDFFVNQDDYPIEFSNEDLKEIEYLKFNKYLNDEWNLKGNYTKHLS